jgi:hypothetical protein
MAAEGNVPLPLVGPHEDVHVTGRRILVIIVDGLLVGIPSSLISPMLFGTSSVCGTAWTLRSGGFGFDLLRDRLGLLHTPRRLPGAGGV